MSHSYASQLTSLCLSLPVYTVETVIAQVTLHARARRTVPDEKSLIDASYCSLIILEFYIIVEIFYTWFLFLFFFN